MATAFWGRNWYVAPVQAFQTVKLSGLAGWGDAKKGPNQPFKHCSTRDVSEMERRTFGPS
jgi:hypothetical protein